MKTLFCAAALAVATLMPLGAAQAESWYEPQRGTQERRDLMDFILVDHQGTLPVDSQMMMTTSAWKDLCRNLNRMVVTIATQARALD